MRRIELVAVTVAWCMASTAFADEVPCPKWEPGARYPWQSNEIMRGDKFAWVLLDVDRDGVPFKCRIGDNNYIEPEPRFWLCKNFSDRWRAPKAAPTDPDKRRFERYSLVASYEHDRADRKARKRWFAEHPGERPQCYPEPTRPDRLG